MHGTVLARFAKRVAFSRRFLYLIAIQEVLKKRPVWVAFLPVSSRHIYSVLLSALLDALNTLHH
jgi:hypothetical protein